ncbi:PhoD-like phosphatase-domain-containing protein [Chaetomidium leptoderma]|uniref:PhoD-like phosphatase-domain-containing protein n=1 Tax=Chaetomidium leptoderma TaxID=669021 RepID=A0AAN6VQE6_9PEZI|nr:PhoD-like phosphatase-domain-containing protein [Chaetomidium leptoderma]
MATTQTRVATAASIGLRALSYIFLRWIAPAIIFTLFVIYLPAFVSGYRQEPKYNLVDEVDVVVTETTVEDADAPENRNGRTPPNGDKEVEAEDVTIEETISIENRPLNPLRTLLTGAPNPRSLALSLATLLLNALCVSLVADRLFRERSYPGDDLSFARVGYVSENEAKLLIREPDQSKMPVKVEVHIKDPQPPFDNPLWQNAGGVRWTTDETDYTAVLSIPLRHSKKRIFEWRTSNNHSGEFTVPPPIGHAEETNYGPFTFLATSCIVPRLPYNPFDHPLAIPGFRHLAKVLPSLNAQFMLFLGDFIYADVPRYWDKSTAYYREKYRQIYASPDWPAVGQNLSWIHVLDDHEIANDWSANSTGVYEAAIGPFDHYQAAANPPQAKKAGALTARAANTSYFEFTQGPASFFLLDTRSFRSSNDLLPSDDPDKTMLGTDQLADFLAWLRRPEPKGVKWKIVASSVPFTKNWPVNTQDTWGGFLAERRIVLEAMWDVASRGVGVVVLSGDRHEFAATKFPPPEDGKWHETATVWEFSASPLSQFYSPIPTYRQRDGEDVMVKYIYKGNSKFGAITIENLEGGDQSSMKYRLYVDGEEVWNTVVLSPPPPANGGRLGGSDGHRSCYDWEFIRDYTYSPRGDTKDIPEVLFGAEAALDPPTVEHDHVKDSEDGVGKLTMNIVKHGFTFVNNVPFDSPDATQELLERIAFIRQTHYGGFYDFKPDLAMADTAYTNLALPAHTDTTYFTEPAGLQAFHMLSHEPAEGESQAWGGQSLLVDGFHAARTLQTEDKQAYDILSRVRLPWHASGNKDITIGPDQMYPVLEHTAGREERRLNRIRWNNDDRGVLPLSEVESDSDSWYDAARKWDEIIRRPELQFWFQLEPGKLLIFDNWRVLHGRSAFSGIRRMCGGYINRDDFISRWRNTNFSRKENLIKVRG